MLKDLYEGFHTLVFPPHCLLCQHATDPTRLNGYLCPRCLESLQENHPPFCLKCSRHLRQVESGQLCKNCRSRPPEFDFAWSALLLNDSLKRLLHLFKYYQRCGLHRFFTPFMCGFIDKYGLDIRQFDCLIPIPLFNSNLRERGFNQSRLLAEAIATVFDLPVAYNILIKARPTHNQVELGQKERWTNIKGAFKIKHPESVKMKNFLIVDDLLTTGATVNEAARCLKTAGAGTVGVLTLAITY